jgi:hypothetical protein
MRWASSLLLLLTLSCAGAGESTAPAAESLPAMDPDASRYVINVYELIVEYPPPVWASLKVTANHFHREQQGGQFILEQVPEDEKFADWTRIYAILALHSVNGRFETFQALAVREWYKACPARHLALQSLRDEPSHWQILVFCESSADGPAASGWGADVGAVTLMDVQKMSNTFVRVHHTWRGERFDREDRSSWPVQEDEIREMIGRFSRIRLSYDPHASQTPR